MNILGISAGFHDAAVTVIKDDEVVLKSGVEDEDLDYFKTLAETK